MMSCPHSFVHISITENEENLIFRYDNINLTLYLPKINWGIIFLVTYFNTGVYFCLHLAIFFSFTISCMMRVINCEGMTSSPQLNIHKNWSSSVFPKRGKFQTSWLSYSSYPIFTIFAPFCMPLGFLFSFSKKWNHVND